MLFQETPLAGAYRVDPEPRHDPRGFFARTFCVEEFQAHGLNGQWVQHNISFNVAKGTLRGLHYQCAPHAEIKVVRCTAGAVYDVIVDLRPGSPTHAHWFGVELSADNRRMLYIPAGFAHGFQTLVPNSELFYLMSTFYHPEAARGVVWDDPTLNIAWPEDERILSERDRALPRLSS
ncbi:MAG: dTDP-4-dehydrorhamnose 3,5-epimerase [Magnetococcales bacterium]|nr:dTDP-4-dehydrorhamnose 3,5-epimerase [Magnetococcales bacterium]